MAIPCEQCGQPVHERAVVCPHCAGESGVGADPIAVAEISILYDLEHKPEPIPLPLLVKRPKVARPTTPAGLPRAIARKRR
ncbi:MAG: hypothetical protein ABI467_26950 [Kofleriaceae bacterium]